MEWVETEHFKYKNRLIVIMKTALLLFLIVIGNLALYWVFYGKKAFEKRFELSSMESKKKFESKSKKEA